MSLQIPHWNSQKQLTAGVLGQQQRNWLFDNGSLTRNLRRHCDNEVSLELLSQCRDRPFIDEQQAMDIAPKHSAMVRQVRLFCHGQPMIFARSVIPLLSLSGAGGRLMHLGNRPLADLLFANRGTRRSKMQFAQLRAGNPLYSLAVNALGKHPFLWARRTYFIYENKPLLVCEVFSPRLLQDSAV